MPDARANHRLEAFCDAVFAIAATLLILDVRLPETASITTAAELWRALGHLGPSVFAFVLSFAIILITWVNHHATMKLIGRSSATFIYWNGFLLLTVVSLPFPATLLGAFLLTDHAAPAVVVYDAVLVLNAIAWVLFTGAAIRGHLAVDAEAEATLRVVHRRGYGATVLYGALTATALWLPLTAAVATTVTWIYWLIIGLRMKHE